MTVRFSARGRLSRAAVGAVLALWSVFALLSGDARALCLDLGGGCSPSAAVPTGPCHDEAPASGEVPGCTSCVDILIHEDALAGGGLSAQELQPPAAARPFGFTRAALPATEGTLAASAASLIDHSPPCPADGTAVLRI